MRILITGGCGFIGSHIAEHHLAKGDIVHVVDNLSTGTLDNISSFRNNPSFIFSQDDLLTWHELESVIKSTDRIYHFAAVVGIFRVLSDPESVISTNIIASRRLFQSIADSSTRPTVVLASSSSVYGDSPKNPLNENDNLIVKPPSHPLATYAISKIADEAIALAYYRSKKIPIIMPRLFNTIGPRQTGRYGMVVPRFVYQACHHQPFTIFGDGKQTRSFCDVRDVVTMIDLLAQEPKAIGEAVNVGNDHEITINDLAKVVNTCMGDKNQSEYIPYKKAYGTDFTDIHQRRPDISKLMRLINYTHKWTLESTINDLISNTHNI